MNSNIYTLLTVAVLATAVYCDNIPLKDCGSDQIKIEEFNIEGCTNYPCIFPRGQNVTGHIKLSSTGNFQSLTNKIFGQIAGVNVPFPFPQEDSCANGVSCPVKVGDVNTETIQIPVVAAYPKLSLIVQFQINDENGKKQACGLFPVKIE